MPDHPEAFSPTSAALFLGLSTSTLAKLRLTGNGPSYCKLGRRVVYLREDLSSWLESRRTRSTSEADARLPRTLTKFPPREQRTPAATSGRGRPR